MENILFIFSSKEYAYMYSVCGVYNRNAPAAVEYWR
jgi:hypothetical protein